MLVALLPYSLFASGVLGALALFVSLKREIARQGRKHEQQIVNLTGELKEAKRSAAPRGGMTAHKREQAILLMRQGADAAGIARSLELPRREIELLLRICCN